MGVTFKIAEAPRVYVERVDINGNTHTQDKVIRREFRLAEGDAFNSCPGQALARPHPVARLFPGKARDRAEARLGARPRRPRGQRRGEVDRRAPAFGGLLEPRAVHRRRLDHASATSWARARRSAPASIIRRYSKSVELGFTEPYLFDRNIALGVDIFRRDYNSFNFINNDRNTTYEQTTTGFQIALGVPLTEYMSLALRYGLNYRRCVARSRQFYSDSTDRTARRMRSAARRPLSVRRDRQADRPRRSAIRWSTTISTTASARAAASGSCSARISPGSAASVKYIRTRVKATKYWQLSAAASSSRSASRAAISTASKKPSARRRSGPPDRPLLPRRAADARLRHPRRRPARPAHPPTTDDRQRSIDRADKQHHRRRARRHGLIISAGSSSRFRSASGARNSVCGRRSSSMSARCSGRDASRS